MVVNRAFLLNPTSVASAYLGLKQGVCCVKEHVFSCNNLHDVTNSNFKSSEVDGRAAGVANGPVPECTAVRP